MKKKPAFIKWFADMRIEDIPLVGGKQASLGELYRTLTDRGAACSCSMRNHE